MSNELRYLLHGNKQKYEDVTTPLYFASQESTVWQKVGKQVLQRRGEAWRLLDPTLVEHIPQDKHKRLGIILLESEQVLNLIRELGAECVDGSLLEPSERYKLLSYIGQRPINEDLWKALQVHEATNGQIVRIEADRMYLENQDFPLDERLNKYVVLIRQNNQEIKQDWIPLWTPNAAIATILKCSNPHEYCELILDALQRMSPQDQESWSLDLQNANWLPGGVDSRGIRPLDVLRLPENLVQHEQAIASLDGTKHPESILPKSVRTSTASAWVVGLFTYWDAETVTRKVLTHSDKSFRYWSDFCTVILDAVQDLDIPKDLERPLKTEKWLLLGNRQIAPEQVIEIVPSKLKQHLSALVDLSADEYTESSRLPHTIKNHKSFKSLSRLFCRWYENNVISFILGQPQPHNYLNITLDALSSLFSTSQHPLTSNNSNSLKISAWLADAEGNAVYPQNVLHYQSLQAEIQGLLMTVPCSFMASSQLAKQIRARESCWQWLTKELFVTQDKALVLVSQLLKQAPEYQLGEFQLDEFPLDTVLEVFDKIDVSFLPAWKFAKYISNQQKFKQYLLPNLLGKIDEEKVVKILQSLAAHNSQLEESTVSVFNCYLGLAVRYNTFRQKILGKIHLLNRRSQWQTPNKLTWGNMDNIDDAYVLDSKQAEVMRPYLDLLQKINSTVLPTSVTAVDETNGSVLKKYFRAWDQYCPSEPIGAFLSLLGSEGNVKELAHLYLGNRNLDIIRRGLFENQRITYRVFRIHVGQASDRTRDVQSLLGETFKASLANTKNPPHLFVSKLAPDVTELELIAIQPHEFTPSNLVDLLEKSTRVLLKEVYKLSPSSLNDTWENLLQSDQLDIQLAKNMLLLDAPKILREWGTDNKSPVLKEILTRRRNFLRQKEELKLQNRALENIDKQINNIVSELSNLLEGESPESDQLREKLLQSVQEKIKQYGYHLPSIPFELFQNADDAVIEWMGMSPTQKLEEKRKQFIVVCTENKLLFIHAGRPIGCFQHPDCPEKQYQDKGFDQDLEKMLTLNISDKGEGVTGKFGLGFKSIYLVCKRPCVLSKSLGFSVEGGLMPSRLNPEKRNELRKNLDDYIGLAEATIVELDIDQNISVQDVLEDFQDFVSILLVFSKGIKTYKFIDKQHQEVNLSWNASPVLNVVGVETSKYCTTSDGRESVLLCLKTMGEAEASLLLGIVEQKDRLRNALPEDTPTFWVTAPTREKLFLGFVLNANFDITPGRESLVKSSADNRELAKRIGKALGEVLCNLFRASEDNWQALAAALNITTTDEYEFWNFLWEELAVRWQQKDPSEGIDIIGHMLGGDRAMGYLITRCQSLPNGLYGRYRQLISLDNVNYRVTGKLSEESCFLKVASWSSFQQRYQDNLIADDKWQEVKKLLGAAFDERRYTVRDLQLLNVLKNEIGVNEPKVKPSQASYIGNLISKEFFNGFCTSSELSNLQSFLETVHFMSKAVTYLPCQQLLISSSSVIEENLLVGFAPDSRILHPDYKDKDTTLNLFYACRSRRDSISLEELVKWALQAETSLKQEAVHFYLLKGERRDELAPVLYNNRASSWIGNVPNVMDTLELMVLVATKQAEVFGKPDPLKDAPILDLTNIYQNQEDIENHNPNFEIRTICTRNDFSLERSQQELEAFARMLLEALNRQSSSWKGHIYHFTHVENAVSILQGERLLARNLCHNFSNSAGENLIARTSNDVKDFARFYFRPKTPTQWHNESLGKRKGNIYALCPVPIFFCLNLERVLETHGSKCGVSNGNLAASGAHYGNSTTFLKQCFDFDNVYSTLQQVGKETFLRASQQEFIVHHQLDFTKLNLDDISIICRTTQDKQLLLHMIGRDSKYANRVFEEQDIAGYGSLFYHDNPSVRIQCNGQFIEVQIDNYDKYADIIKGELFLRFTQDKPWDREIRSQFNDISRIFLGQSICVRASRGIQLQYKPNTRMSVYFQECEKDWLIYTNEPRNY